MQLAADYQGQAASGNENIHIFVQLKMCKACSLMTKEKYIPTYIEKDNRRLLSQRITALDLARFLAMVMMIQGHTIYALASPDVIDITTFPWNIWHFCRGITAPVFLMVSGAVHVFANKRDDRGRIPRKTIIRRIRIALILIFIGYILVFPCQRIWDLPFVSAEGWDRFFQVNILQLFGLSLILILGAFVLTRSDKQLAVFSGVTALAITFLGPFVHSIDWFAILPGPLAAYMAYDHGSLFPIFPFSSYLFYGVVLGVILKRIDPEKRTRSILVWGIPSGIVFIVLGYFFSNSLMGIKTDIIDMSRSGLDLVFIRVGFVLAGLSLISLLYLKTKKLTKYYSLFGKRALFIYIGHLVIIYGSAIFPSLNSLYAKSLSLHEVLPIVVIVEAATLAAVYYYEYTIHKYPKSRIFYKYLLAAYLIYVVFI